MLVTEQGLDGFASLYLLYELLDAEATGNLIED
jgi:hypothetical protein